LTALEDFVSRIYFHSLQEDAEVLGPERHMAGHICMDLLTVAIGADSDGWYSEEPHPLAKLVPDGHYLHGYRGAQFGSSFRTWFRVAGEGDRFKTPGGEGVSPFICALNTAWVMGSDPVKLMARLHGQCEIHAYVEGPNRAWLADIIERGREVGIMRAEMGWESVIELLRARDDGPVVTSYSVCDQFPNRHVAALPEAVDPADPDGDRWYDLPAAARWASAVEGLRAGNAGRGLEMKPDNWADYSFGDGVNGFQLRELVSGDK
jgi:hypothetical protein